MASVHWQEPPYVQDTLRNTTLLRTTPDERLQCEPWTTLKRQEFKTSRTTGKYDGFISMVKESSSNMLYIRQWLEGATGQYKELLHVPMERWASLIMETDIRFCLEYHHTIFKGDDNGAVIMHRRKLREKGHGYSYKKQSTRVPTPQNQESRQSVIHQQSAAHVAVSRSEPSKSRPTRRKTPHCPPNFKGEFEDTGVPNVAPGVVDVSPPAKKQKMDRNYLGRLAGKTASNESTSTEPRRSPRSKEHLQRTLSNNYNTIHGDTGPQNTPGGQARSQANVRKIGRGSPAQHTASDNNFKRKASEDAEKSSPKKRSKKAASHAVKSKGDSLPGVFAFGPGMLQIDCTINSSPPHISSISASLGSMPVATKKKRKLTMRQSKVDVVACDADTLKDTAQLPSPPCRPEPQCLALACAVDKLATQDSGNSNNEALGATASMYPEHISAGTGVVTLSATFQPAQTITEEQPHISTDKTQDVPSGTPDSKAEAAPLQTAIVFPVTENERRNTNIIDSSIPENITHISEDDSFVTLTPSLTTSVSAPPPDTPDETVTSISSTPLLPNIGQPSSCLGPSSVTPLTLFPVKTELNLAEDLLEGFGPSSNSPLLHDIGMTDIPITAASELTIEEDDVPRFPRAPLVKYPPIWSESRQELCESFDWFRSYQGGVYFTGGAVKGYLLSAFGAKRDFFKYDGKFIVSHGGGRAESLHSTKGNLATVAAGDQLADDKSVRALRQNYVQQRPLALVIDEKYPLFPHELTAHMNVTYAVLGFYTIAHMWAEYQNANNEQGRVVRYKFAFRWCDSQGAPWWTTPNEAECPDNVAEESPREARTIMSELIVCSCLHCKEESKQVYSLCWVCLNPDCGKFWRQSDNSFLPEQVSYHPGFLTLPPSGSVPANFKLKPVYPIPSNAKKANEIVATAPTSYPFTRGFHCTDCGRLSCRSQWARWECLNCHHSLTIIGNVRRAKEFWGKNIISSAFRDNYVNKISGIERLSAKKFDIGTGLLGDVQTFVLPRDRGKIHHIQPGSPLGSVEADKIFEDYQAQAAKGELLFRRWPLRAHKCRGTLLTNYFSQNTGQPYQYVGGDAHTVPFESAPSAIVAARDLLQTRVNRALGRGDAEFNEILSAAYMERQKMAFHSDNEPGLGPLVAGLSMGAAAMMHFRLHPKHDPERRQRGIMLSFTLRHGDILVMDGSGVQEFYEHTVVPTNFRIAATARQITPAHR